MSHCQKTLYIPQRVSSARRSRSGSSSRHSSPEKQHTTAGNMCDEGQGSNQGGAIPVCFANEDDSRLAPPRNKRETADRVALSTIKESTASNDESIHPGQRYTSPSGTDRHLDPDLRQRASSPLLGHSYKRNHGVSHASIQPLPKPMRVAGSSSTLHSFYDPHQSLPSSSGRDTAITEPEDLDLRDHESAPPPPPPASKSTSDLGNKYHTTNSSHYKDRRTSKLRPMLDLSKLFPRHRDSSSPQVLSPTRMVSSPSPVSMLSDSNPPKTSHGPMSFGRFTKPSKHNDSLLTRRRQKEQQQQQQFREGREVSEEQRRPSSERRDEEEREHFERQVPKPLRPPTRNIWNRREAFANWFDGPQGQVSDGEEEYEDDGDVGTDMNMQSHSPQDMPADNNNRTFHESLSVNSIDHSPSGRSNRASMLSGTSSRTVRFSSGSSSTLKPPQGTPSNSLRFRSGTVRSHSTLNEWEGSSNANNLAPQNRSRASSASQSFKGFDGSNLNESSVLLLSSEDEEEEEGRGGEAEDNTQQTTGNRTFVRDSIATFDEGEICTAKAAVAANRKPSIRRVKANGTPQNQDSPQSLEFHVPRPQSGASERQAAADRRSRVLALTRQEEHLIEVIRRHKAPIPSASFNDNESVSSGNPDWYASSASRRSHGTGPQPELSYLKLNSGSRPTSRRRRRRSNNKQFNLNTGVNCNASASTESEDSASRTREQGTGTGTDHSGTSPRLSLAQSDALPSPSTGQDSPRTPTHLLTPQRFSLQQSPPNPPPNFSPPPVPEQPRRRRSRTRTDRSSPLVFQNTEGDDKDVQTSPDMPIWALGWNQELGGMAVAH